MFIRWSIRSSYGWVAGHCERGSPPTTSYWGELRYAIRVPQLWQRTKGFANHWRSNLAKRLWMFWLLVKNEAFGAVFVVRLPLMNISWNYIVDSTISWNHFHITTTLHISTFYQRMYNSHSFESRPPFTTTNTNPPPFTTTNTNHRSGSASRHLRDPTDAAAESEHGKDLGLRWCGRWVSIHGVTNGI